MARPGPGNGWRPTKFSGRPSSRPSARTSSLNSSRNGSTSFMCHPLGQAADVVVRLDRHRRAAGERHRFDHVGVERALGEEFDRAAAVGGDLLRLALEGLDEQAADRLALGLRLGDAVERAQEVALGGDMDERNVEMAAEQPDHLRRPRRRASGRGRRRRRSAGRRSPRGSAPPRPPNRRRRRGRR